MEEETKSTGAKERPVPKKNKTLTIVLWVMAALALLYAWFGPKAQEPQAQVSNPLVEVDAAALEEAGLPLLPPQNATDVTYVLIGDNLAQMDFQLDGAAYCCRATKVKEQTDISGVYNGNETRRTWEENGLQLESCDGDSASWIGWYDPDRGVQHCLSAKTDLAALQAAAEQLYQSK